MKTNVWTIGSAIVLIVVFGLLVKKQIRENMDRSDPMLERLRDLLIPIHPGFKNVKLYKADKSYTINKDKIYLCLRDKKTGEYVTLNMLVYVILHEYAHFLNKEDVGHTKHWQDIFDSLLVKASEIGIYNPSIPIIDDYSE